MVFVRIRCLGKLTLSTESHPGWEPVDRAAAVRPFIAFVLAASLSELRDSATVNPANVRTIATDLFAAADSLRDPEEFFKDALKSIRDGLKLGQDRRLLTLSQLFDPSQTHVDLVEFAQGLRERRMDPLKTLAPNPGRLFVGLEAFLNSKHFPQGAKAVIEESLEELLTQFFAEPMNVEDSRDREWLDDLFEVVQNRYPNSSALQSAQKYREAGVLGELNEALGRNLPPEQAVENLRNLFERWYKSRRYHDYLFAFEKLDARWKRFFGVANLEINLLLLRSSIREARAKLEPFRRLLDDAGTSARDLAVLAHARGRLLKMEAMRESDSLVAYDKLNAVLENYEAYRLQYHAPNRLLAANTRVFIAINSQFTFLTPEARHRLFEHGLEELTALTAMEEAKMNLAYARLMGNERGLQALSRDDRYRLVEELETLAEQNEKYLPALATLVWGLLLVERKGEVVRRLNLHDPQLIYERSSFSLLLCLLGYLLLGYPNRAKHGRVLIGHLVKPYPPLLEYPMELILDRLVSPDDPARSYKLALIESCRNGRGIEPLLPFVDEFAELENLL